MDEKVIEQICKLKPIFTFQRN